MDYITIIKSLHKLLRVYEERDFNDYKSYLSCLIQDLDGIDEPSEELVRLIRRLKGLKKWTEEETTHHDVKDCVLDGRGKLERERERIAR
jgi:hypothetical protein